MLAAELRLRCKSRLSPRLLPNKSGTGPSRIHDKITSYPRHTLLIPGALPGLVRGVSAPRLYRRLARELSLPLFDFSKSTAAEHAQHVASSCGHYAPRTRGGVRAAQGVVLDRARPCCDCTHFCHSSSFWERSAILPLTRLLFEGAGLSSV